MKKIMAFVFIMVIALMCTGCFLEEKAELQLVEIVVAGFDTGLSEISITNDRIAENASISVSAKAIWKTAQGDFTVAWEFVGDDLGCQVYAIDPGCTGGRIANMHFGDEIGTITLRATATSKNKVSTDLTIRVGEESQIDDTFDYQISDFNENFNGEFKLAEKIPLEVFDQDYIDEFLLEKGFGCYFMKSNDGLTQYTIGGFPDCLDEYAITDFCTEDPNYEIFGFSVGSSLEVAETALTQLGYELYEGEDFGDSTIYTLGKIRIMLELDNDDCIQIIRVNLTVTNKEGVDF